MKKVFSLFLTIFVSVSAKSGRGGGRSRNGGSSGAGGGSSFTQPTSYYSTYSYDQTYGTTTAILIPDNYSGSGYVGGVTGCPNDCLVDENYCLNLTECTEGSICGGQAICAAEKQREDEEFTKVMIWIGAVVGAVILACIGCCVCCCVKGRKSQSEDEI